MPRFILVALATVVVVATALLAGWRSWTDILGGPLFITTQKVCQVTGKTDRQFNRPTLNPKSNITGSDLGSPVQWGSDLYFLFGDTRDMPEDIRQSGAGSDSVAVGPVNWDVGRHGCPTLDFKTDDIDNFLPMKLEEEVAGKIVTNPLGLFETPISGVVSETSLYAFFTLRDTFAPGCSRPDGCALGDSGPAGGRTVLAQLIKVTKEDGFTFRKVSNVSKGRFQWPVAVVRDIRTIPDLGQQIGLPSFTGQVAVIFAAGREENAFRHGYPFLAVVPLKEISDMQKWNYFSKIRSDGKPEFIVNNEAAAKPLPPFGHETFTIPTAGSGVDLSPAMQKLLFGHVSVARVQPPYHKCVGELSVAYMEEWGKWAMLYACGDTRSDGFISDRGIYLRTADVPWGPWSGPRLIFDPEDGYCHFMYKPVCKANEPNPKDDGWDQDAKGLPGVGGEYAPMLLPTYTKVEGDSTSLYFLMSTWNPYQVVLMRTLIRPPSSLSTRVMDTFKWLSRQK